MHEHLYQCARRELELYHQVRKTVRCYAQHSIRINPSHQISNKPQIPRSIAQGITFEMHACFRTSTLQLPNPIPSIVYQIESQTDRLLFLSTCSTLFYKNPLSFMLQFVFSLIFYSNKISKKRMLALHTLQFVTFKVVNETLIFRIKKYEEKLKIFQQIERKLCH